MSGLNNTKPVTDLDKLLQEQEENNEQNGLQKSHNENNNKFAEYEEFEEFDTEYSEFSEDDTEYDEEFDDSDFEEFETDETDDFPNSRDSPDEIAEEYTSGAVIQELDIEEMQKQENEAEPEAYDSSILKKKTVEYSVAAVPVSADIGTVTMQMIDGVAVAFTSLEEARKAEEAENDREHIRTYDKGLVKPPKTVFRKPKEETGFLPKLIMMIAACIGVGVFLGLQTNSYYIYAGGKVESYLSCTFSWMTVENMPFRTSPFNGSAFWTGFAIGFGILAVIMLFTYLDNDAKKLSRVGHEHGNARLGTPKDFKTFKNRFME